jgi:hypothetical protein
MRVPSQQLALERVALLTSHRRDVKRIIERRQLSLDHLLGAAMNPRDPSIRGSVRPVRITRSDPGRVGRYNLVGVLLEFASELVAERLAPGLRLRPPDLRASLRAFRGIEPCLARVSQSNVSPF